MRCERGQATIEWVGLVLLASLALGALATAVPLVDGRSFGGFLAHRILCAVKDDCDGGDAALAAAYGPRDAELLRRHAPDIVYEPGEESIPVDFRDCRAPPCASAADERGLDVHTSSAGLPATAFTRVIRRGGRTYLQYWLYYPDSNTALAGSDRVWNALPLGRYPGFHRDDWEGYQVRLDRRSGAGVRATSHGHYQWCKQASCRNRWGPPTGWTRVSRGSHAGHIPLRRAGSPPAARRRGHRGGPGTRARARLRPELPGRDLHERTTTAEGLLLVPLETLDRRAYRRLDRGVSPPWEKRVYRDPESGES